MVRVIEAGHPRSMTNIIAQLITRTVFKQKLSGSKHANNFLPRYFFPFFFLNGLHVFLYEFPIILAIGRFLGCAIYFLIHFFCQKF